MPVIEKLDVQLEKKKHMRKQNKQYEEAIDELMLQKFKKKYPLKNGRQRPRHPDETKILNRLAKKNGTKNGTI